MLEHPSDVVFRHRIGLLCVSIAAIAWSSAGFFVKVIPVDAWTMLFWRGIFGGVFVTFITLCIHRSGTFKSSRAIGLNGLLILVFSTFSMVALIPAFKMTAVANVVVITATVPIVTAIMAWFLLREAITLMTAVSSGIVIIGIAIMVGDSTAGLSQWGEILAMVSTCISAAALILIRRFHQVPLLPITCLSCFLGAALVFPLAQPFSVSLTELAYLAVFGFIQIVLGLALFNLGSRLIPAAQTGLIVVSQTPLAPFWVWLFLNEIPTPPALIGGALVFAAVLSYFLLPRLSFSKGLRIKGLETKGVKRTVGRSLKGREAV